MRSALARRVYSVALGLGLAVVLACTTHAQQLPADFFGGQPVLRELSVAAPTGDDVE